MVNVVEQALLLPGDMADLRTIKKYEVFLKSEERSCTSKCFFFPLT